MPDDINNANWPFGSSSTQELLNFLERRPLDRMERAFQEAAQEELKRREIQSKKDK